MSFNFKWPTFSKEFHESAAQMLDNALNKGPKPKVIADDIKVEELGMGTIPPDLEILEIGDLGTDRFRGIFRLTYAGDAHLVLRTKVQANPLSKPSRPDIGLFPSSTASRGILFAAAPLVVPMHLRLSDVKLRAIVVLVVSKAKGITLVFKNDPLESVQVSSTFDSVAVLQKYLQQEIETQLREMFREDLPGIIHRLSQRWLSGEAEHEHQEARRRSEAQQHQQQQQQQQQQQHHHHHQQYRHTPVPRSSSDPHGTFETASEPGGPPRQHTSTKSKSARRPPSVSAASAAARKTLPTSPPRPRSAGRRPKHSAKATSMSAAPLFNELLTSSFPEIENYDPTYGLRPDDLPTHSGFSGLGKLAQRVSGGLRDLTSPPQPEAAAANPSVPHAPAPSSSSSSSSSFPFGAGSSFAPQGMGRGPAPGSDDLGGIDSDASDPAATGRKQQHQDDSDGYSSQDDVSDSLPERDDNDEEDDEQEDNDEEDDDVPDLLDPLDTLADTSIDYTRFGYPPASAAFSDTHEVNRASSIIFDDEPGPPPSSLRRGGSGSGNGGRRRAGSTGKASGGGGGSIRSARTSGSSGRRRPSGAGVEYETIPAVGGGTVTRPRVYHIASKVQPPEVDWDDESTARPSQYGGGSSRTGGATRYGSEMGSTTMGGGRSSRTNTVHGLSSPRLDAECFPDGSEESLLELPPESLHSSGERSSRRMPHAVPPGWRSGSSASSASASARQSSSGHGSGGYGGAYSSAWTLSRVNSSSRYTGGWDHSGASSSAPTSLPPSGLGSASDLGFQHQRGSFDASTTASGGDGQQGGGGIRFRKGKNVARPRPAASASLDRAGFVTATQLHGGHGGGGFSSPLSQGQYGPSQARDVPSALATSPERSSGGPYSSSGGRSGGGGLSTSPFSQRDLLSRSPSYQGSPRSHFAVSSASYALQQAAGGSNGNGTGTTKLSIDASAHFADLVKSNHTLSPFTRNMEHFTVRSAPVTPGWQHGGGGGSVVGSAANSSHSAASGSGTGTGTGTGSGGSQSTGHHRSNSSMQASLVRQGFFTRTTSKTTQTDSPARRRRTFQLGGGGVSNSDSATFSSSSTTVYDPSLKKGPQGGITEFAEDKARGGHATRSFVPPSTGSGAGATSSRSRHGAMGPPSEVARVNAARWEAIRE